MIYKGEQEINGVYRGEKDMIAIYYGKLLVWQLANSCFGAGYWINDRPWSNTEGWKNL